MRLWLAALALALLAGLPTSPIRAAETPALVARFEASRDFGYHIGDLVPLALLIEAEDGIVVDLENLPSRGEAVGPFEVRDVRIHRSRTASGTAYRVEFILQSFVPAAVAGGVAFPPLDLRFALPADRAADGTYGYRTVMLPPYVFFLSPTAVRPGALRPNKGSVVPPPGPLFWGTVGAGAASVAAAMTILGIDLTRWWRRRSAEKRSKAEQRALGTLRRLRERYLACDEMAPVLFGRTSGVLRRFLGEHCGLPARVETIREIQGRFRGHPLQDGIGRVLERCNAVVYDGHHPTRWEKEEIIRDVADLIRELERVGCPTGDGDNASG